MSLWLTLALTVQYIILTVVSLAEGRRAQALYWLGAALLSLGVIGMRQ